MSHKTYNWKRFWCPRSGSISLADGGYLSDPEATWGKAYNPDLVTFDTLLASPCVALLGEPGIGKTQALERETSELVNKIKEQGNQSFFLNLRSYGDESRLVRKLFESPEFIAWNEGSHQLHIFLDSLDECLLRIDTLATLLVDEFRPYQDKVDRLYLRIACRTAVWPSVLEEGLKTIWGKDAVEVYELAPLRRVDIEEAAKDEGFLPDSFLEDVRQKNIVPLAIKPVTLGFLLNTYRRYDNQFSENQGLCDLYLEGCRLLCEEVNESRRDSGRVGDLDVDQRLIVAARIAAITIFANKFAVWTGVDRGDILDEDLLLSKLCHGSESANGRRFDITQEVVEEVLDTGLFSSRGLDQMGWAHQTYAEFLAAWYLKQHKTPLAKVKELIFSSEDPDHRLTPQLHEVSSWAASMRVDVLREIIQTDPDILLQSDIPIDGKLRASIVENLLTLYDQGKLCRQGWESFPKYEKLKHPNLYSQLCPYVCDSTKQVDARELAIDIAEACDVKKLQFELVDLALDSSQSIYLRVNAASALCKLGDAEILLRLKPLAINPLLEDENDQLKGYALQAVWPDLMTSTELFHSLRLPKRENFFGSYQSFIEDEFTPKLQPDDLIVALTWLEKQGLRYGHPFDKSGDIILLKAWENFNDPIIVEIFTRIALLQLQNHQRIIQNGQLAQQFSTSLVADTNKRRMFLEELIVNNLEREKMPHFILSTLTDDILFEDDVFWMIDNICQSYDESIQQAWAQLLKWSFNQQDSKQVDAIVVAAQNNSILHEVFAYNLEIIELGSDKAKKIKAEFTEMHTLSHKPKLLDPSPRERVLNLLDKLEDGNLDAWWQLNREMTLKADSRYYDNEFELDLTKLPVWKDAEEFVRRRIIDGAVKYLQDKDDILYTWIGTNTYDRPTLGACKAFLLILREKLEAEAILTSEMWTKWAPGILAVPTNDQGNSYLELVRLAYAHAPQEFVTTLINLIDRENKNSSYIFITNRIEKCWDEPLKLALLEKSKDNALHSKCFGQLIEELLKRGLNEARDLAQSLIHFPLPTSENERQKALIGSRILFENSDPSSWVFLWSLIEQDSSFGREFLELGAHRYFDGMKLNITEKQLADLYLWLVTQYPYDEDPDYSNDLNAHDVTDRDCMSNLRNSVLSQLQDRGTPQACVEIRRIIQDLPHILWLTKTLVKAEEATRRRTWKPPKPEDILQLVMVPEPSNFYLSNQLGQIGQDIEQMADKPKIVNNIHAPNSSINAPIGNSGPVNNQVTNNPTPVPEKEANWGNRIAIISLLVAIAAIPIGVFNPEINQHIKQWFNQNSPATIEPQSKPSTK
jgi:predicted NACHT family NTPase